LVPSGYFGPLEIAVPLPPLDLSEREINLCIHIDKPRSPCEAGISSDRRRLGFFIKSVRIDS